MEPVASTTPSPMPVVYIIGPYAACDGRTEQENVTRAVALGSLALHLGMVPIIPHITIGCSSLLLGRYEQADEIARHASYAGPGGGLAGWLHAAVLAEVQPFEVWVLERDDESLSTGTKAEKDIVACGGISLPWGRWATRFADAGLFDLYEAAGKPNAMFPRWPGDPVVVLPEVERFGGPYCETCPIGGREGSGPVCAHAAQCDADCAADVAALEAEEPENWGGEDPPIDCGTFKEEAHLLNMGTGALDGMVPVRDVPPTAQALTEAWAERFEKAAADMWVAGPTPGVHPELHALAIEAANVVAHELREQAEDPNLDTLARVPGAVFDLSKADDRDRAARWLGGATGLGAMGVRPWWIPCGFVLPDGKRVDFYMLVDSRILGKNPREGRVAFLGWEPDWAEKIIISQHAENYVVVPGMQPWAKEDDEFTSFASAVRHVSTLVIAQAPPA